MHELEKLIDEELDAVVAYLEARVATRTGIASPLEKRVQEKARERWQKARLKTLQQTARTWRSLVD
jgi:hypothetical protein